MNHYQQINDNHNVLSFSSNYSPANTSKSRLANGTRREFTQHADYERPQGLSQTPDRNIRSNSAATSNCVREQPRINNEHDTKAQVFITLH